MGSGIIHSVWVDIWFYDTSLTKCLYTQRPRRRIDRTMIGEPMNFVHTGHIGSGDVSANDNRVSGWPSLVVCSGY